MRDKNLTAIALNKPNRLVFFIASGDAEKRQFAEHLSGTILKIGVRWIRENLNGIFRVVHFGSCLADLNRLGEMRSTFHRAVLHYNPFTTQLQRRHA